MIDIHTHILPGIDDGAKDIEESLLMLNDAYIKGTTLIYATPHLRVYTDEEFSNALEKRNEAYNLLIETAKERSIEIPEIKLGFEVYMDKDITFFENFKEACLEGTEMMLCEMPFAYWDNFTFGRLLSLKEKGITPVIAHVERYISFKKNIEKLRSMDGIIYQINAESFFHLKERRFVRKLMEEVFFVLAGSDMHGADKRKNLLKEAYVKATKKNIDYERIFNTNPIDII